MKRHEHRTLDLKEASSELTSEEKLISGLTVDSELLPTMRSSRSGSPVPSGKPRLLWTILFLFPVAIVLSLWPSRFSRRAAHDQLPQAVVLDSNAVAEPNRQSTGLTDSVQWDNYTLWLLDQRVFIQYVSCANIPEMRGEVQHLLAPS